MLTAHVAIVSEESKITAAELTSVAGALSKQVSRDFGPIWEVNADVAAYQRLEDVPLDYWPIIVKVVSKIPGVGKKLADILQKLGDALNKFCG